MINNFDSTVDNIAKSTYPLSRGLYFYIKKAHIALVPGIKGFTKAFLSGTEVGKDGYLERQGFITMDRKTYSAIKKTAANLDNLKL